MCGLEVHVEGDRVVAHPARQGRRLEPGLRLPEGRDAGRAASRPRSRPRADDPRRRDVAEVGWDEAFARCEELIARRARAPRQAGADRVHRQPDRAQHPSLPLRRALHRHGAAPDALLGRHRRPVAEERRVHADVRQHVVDPDARHPAHGLLGGDGRQPAGVAGEPPRLPRRARRDRSHPRARRQDGRHRSAPHRHRRPRRRVDPDPARHRRRVPAGALPRALRRRPRAARPARRSRERRRRRRARSRATSRRSAWRTRAACPPRRSAGSRTRSPARSRRRSTAGSASATRSSARSRRGSSTS